MKTIRTLGAGLLILLFLLPAAGFAAGLFGDAQTSENRALASWPSLGQPDYFKGIDAFLSDRFGGRMALIRLSREVRDNLGEDPDAVVRGQDGWLYLGESAYRDEFEGVGAWDDAQVERWVADLLAARDVFEGAGIPFAATIAPDKARIYPETLPKDWRLGGRRFKSRVLGDARLSDLSFDIEPDLLLRKDTGDLVYFARDTHWNPTGGAVASAAIMNALDPSRTLARHDPGAMTLISPYEPQDLERMQGQENSEEVPSLIVPSPRPEGYAVDMVGADETGVPARGYLHTKVVTHSDFPDATGTLVIVGDSFADAMMEFFTPSFRTIVKIHHGAEDFTVGTDEVLSYDPDAVLLMIVERSAHRKARPILVGPTVDE